MRNVFLFDVDGVIVNSEGAKGDSWKGTFEKHDVRKDGVRIDGKAWYIERVGTHGRNLCAEAIETFGIQGVTTDSLFKEQVAYSKTLEAKAETIETTAAFVKELSKRDRIVLGAVSSNYREVIEGHLERAGIYDCFNVITSGVDEVPHDRQKPHPLVYLMTADKLDVAPGRCIGIEDTTPGITAINAAGMYSIGYINPDSGNQDLSEARLRVSDLSKVLLPALWQLTLRA